MNLIHDPCRSRREPGIHLQISLIRFSSIYVAGDVNIGLD